MLCSLVWAVALARAHNFSPTLRQGIELDAAACAGVLVVLWQRFEADKSGSHADAPEFSDCASANRPQRSVRASVALRGLAGAAHACGARLGFCKTRFRHVIGHSIALSARRPPLVAGNGYLECRHHARSTSRPTRASVRPQSSRLSLEKLQEATGGAAATGGGVPGNNRQST